MVTVLIYIGVAILVIGQLWMLRDIMKRPTRTYYVAMKATKLEQTELAEGAKAPNGDKPNTIHREE